MATVAVTGSAFTSTTDTNAYTAAAVGIGADGGNDVLYIVAGCRFTTSIGASSTTCTVDGVSADLQASIDTATATGCAAVCFSINRNQLPDPAQTDVDVVVTWNNTALRCVIRLFKSADASKTKGASATDFDAGAFGTNVTQTLDLNTTASGVVIGFSFAGHAGASVSTHTWTGLTEADDATGPENTSYSTADADNVSAETPRAVSNTFTRGSNDIADPVSLAVAFPVQSSAALGRGLLKSTLLYPRRLVG
jgi:hypothetical protein